MKACHRASLLSCLVAASALTLASGANAFDVPPFKGNDTGGIIAWSLAQRVNAKQLAADHCASYGKLVRPLASQRVYGGYISFGCVWPRPVRSVHVLRVRG